LDPALGSEERSGRVIPHDFVVFPPILMSVHSVEDGLEFVWPLVSEKFERVWDKSPDDLCVDGSR
jgi:hypothetical protein